MAQQPRIIAVLKPPKEKAARPIFAEQIVDAVRGSRWFPRPNPPLSVVRARIQVLQDAQLAVGRRALGSVPARDAAWRALLRGLQRLRDHVQSVADDNPGLEVSIILSAGMQVKGLRGPGKEPFRVVHGEHSGEVRLIAKQVEDRASYEWQYSTDQVNWTRAGHTMQAKFVIRDLKPGVQHWFRFRAVTKKGPTDWGQILGLIVT